MTTPALSPHPLAVLELALSRARSHLGGAVRTGRRYAHALGRDRDARDALTSATQLEPPDRSPLARLLALEARCDANHLAATHAAAAHIEALRAALGAYRDAMELTRAVAPLLAHDTPEDEALWAELARDARPAP